MSYPESTMNVAVHIGNGLVNIYGYENHGYRRRIRTIQLNSKPEAISYCTTFNQNSHAEMLRRQR